GVGVRCGDGGGGFAHQVSSTSAGIRTNSSCPSGFGRLTAFTRQPACCSVPRNGGWPLTFPTSRTDDGAKPAGTVTGDPSSWPITGSRVKCFLIVAWDFV